ncbi:MAG: serine hydroxymethyltransferase, partial [Bdellovibrionales bacterium]
ALKPEFKTYQEQVVKNAKVLGEELVKNGLSLVSGGTDNHLILVDLTSTGVTGKEAEEALDKAGITVNKNTIPNEQRSPFVTSGVRLGTPALTTRGMGEAEMITIAGYISDVVNNHSDEMKLNAIHEKVTELCKRFPLYN